MYFVCRQCAFRTDGWGWRDIFYTLLGLKVMAYVDTKKIQRCVFVGEHLLYSLNLAFDPFFVSSEIKQCK